MRMHLCRTALAFGGLVALSACGGVGGLDADDGIDTAALLGERGSALRSDFEFYQFTRAEDLPTTGSAAFTGVAAFEGYGDHRQAELLSEVSIAADFETGEVSGSLDSFEGNGPQYQGFDGRADLRDGIILPSAFPGRSGSGDGYAGLMADLQGQFSSDHGAGAIGGFILGQFVSNDVRATEGQLLLELSDDQGMQILVGDFVAARD